MRPSSHINQTIQSSQTTSQHAILPRISSSFFTTKIIYWYCWEATLITSTN
ncbi:unnamed protein product [Schistosoma curassoni]|uniref:Uncharacterized protein n=1 Tax=Schistosoma curassoni TaxID=6186 RepID=A0A183KU70_9TREM|nr:unnamed protein product [Schistosoma curassoni]